jgi:hypothetical protein
MSSTPNLEKFIKDAILDLVSNGISLELTLRNIHCNVFDEGQRLIIQRVRGELKDWGPTFIHEYCHFLQWKKGKYASFLYGEAGGDFDYWLKKKVKLGDKELNLIVNRIKRCELDCEKTVVKMIKKHKLEINVEQYTKNANAYIYSYNMIVETKRWYKDSPHATREILDIMPGHFLSRYDRTPKKYRELYLKYCI